MKRNLLLVGTLASLLFFISSCKNNNDPKKVTADFVQSLYKLDFNNASASATEATKPVIEKGKKDLEAKVNLDQEVIKRAEENTNAVFETTSLTALVNGDNATVKNDMVSFSLKKENGDWKIVASDEAVQSILQRPMMQEATQSAWKQLKDEFNRRDSLAQEYVKYKMGSAAKPRELDKIASAVTACMQMKTTTGAERLNFVAKEKQLDELVEGVQPSFVANADLTLNYISSLHASKLAIKNALQNYNDVARKAHIKDYPVLGDK